MKTRTFSVAGGLLLSGALSLSMSSGAYANAFGIGPVLVADPIFDAKNYPGLGCQAREGVQENVLHHWATSVAGKGGTWNGGTGYVLVTCPIVRDNISNPNGTYGPPAPPPAPLVGPSWGVNVWVNNLAPAGAQQLSCQLFSNDPWGGAVAVSNGVAGAGFAMINLDVNLSVPVDGHYSLACVLPPNSSVFSYRVREWLPTSQNN